MTDLHAWLDHVSMLSPLAIAVVALAGLAMGFAPSSLPLYSVVVGYVGGQASRRTKGIVLSAGFVLGMATVDAALGTFFGFLGDAVIRAVAGYLAATNLLLALLLTLFGLALLRKIRIAVPVLRPEARHVHSLGAAYALGIPFGLSTCPACTPMMLPILAAAAATGTPWLGGALLFVFGLARGAPLLVVGTMAGAVKRVTRFAVWVPTIERASGFLLLAAALYFTYQSAVYAGLAPPWALGL